MIAFLLVYTLVYGGANAYVWCCGRRAFELGGPAAAAFAGALALLVAAPVLSRVAYDAGFTALARGLAACGYPWMAFSFWLVVLFGARELWNGGLGLAVRLWPAADRLALPARGSALAFLALVLLAGALGLREAASLRLERVEVRTDRLPAGSAPLRVLFFSDVHLDLLGGEGTLRELARLAGESRPDLILCGGDLVDTPAEHQGEGLRFLRSLSAPLGKYAVLGNHEYYAGLAEAKRFLEAAGFRLLRGEAAELRGRLFLAGVDDPAARQLGAAPTPGEEDLLPRGPGRPAVLLLKHRPEVRAASLGRFDLQLSGHTHGGQIYPFRYLVRLAYRRPDGLSEVGGGSRLYKGRGTGTWGPPLRLLAPPEVTLITLVPAR